VTEQQPYDVIEPHRGFELRRYPEHVVAEVVVSGGFEEVGNRAFRPLFRYISGHNRSRTALAMTAPVVQESTPSERMAMTAPVLQSPSGRAGTDRSEPGPDEYTVAFVLPASVTAETVPEPSDPQVRTRVVPERLAAARRYSGRWTEPSFRRRLAELHESLSGAGLEPVGPAVFARFDPPFTPWFLRRNEVVQGVRRAAER
jgi:hypothetical protein